MTMSQTLLLADDSLTIQRVIELTFADEDIGVVAQEVNEVVPEVVTERDDGYLAVKYEKMIPLLIEAMKEQQDQIDDLKKQIEEFKQEGFWKCMDTKRDKDNLEKILKNKKVKF